MGTERKSLTVNELFSGIGAQYRGIQETGVYACKVNCTSEIDATAIIGYATLHCGLTLQLLENYTYPEHSTMCDELNKLGVQKKVSEPTDWHKVQDIAYVRKVWLSCKLSKNCGDISKVEALSEADLWTYSFPCFPMGTLVYTIDGYKPIEELSVGSFVLTHKGRYRKVTHTSVNMTDALYTLSLRNGESLKTTERHPFYVKENDRAEPKWVYAAEIQPGWFVATPLTQSEGIPEIPLDLIFSKELCQFFAYYVRYGLPTTEDKVTLYNVGTDMSYILNCLNWLGVQHRVFDDNVSVEKQGLGTFCTEFGKDFSNRHLTRYIMNLPLQYLRSFLSAFLRSEKPVQSRILAYDISACIHNAYQRCCSVVACANTYYVKDTVGVVFDTGAYLWREIDGVAKNECSCPVYNLTVSDDNTYVVQNIAVHNCQDLSGIGKQEGIKQGTRSGLLLEVGRLLQTAKVQGILPKYLLMENVPNLLRRKHIEAYKRWLLFLDELGYDTYTKVISGIDCNVPQNRRRCFGISVLRGTLKKPYEFPESLPLQRHLCDLLENLPTEYRINVLSMLRCSLKNKKAGNGFCFTVHNPSKAYIANTITTKAGGRVTDNFVFVEDYNTDTKVSMNDLLSEHNIPIETLAEVPVRKLSPTECFRLMGFKDADVCKLRQQGICDTDLYKLAGNSIIVDCISFIMKQLYLIQSGGYENREDIDDI